MGVHRGSIGIIGVLYWGDIGSLYVNMKVGKIMRSPFFGNVSRDSFCFVKCHGNPHSLKCPYLLSRIHVVVNTNYGSTRIEGFLVQTLNPKPHQEVMRALVSRRLD